jgi:hypothetical protein
VAIKIRMILGMDADEIHSWKKSMGNKHAGRIPFNQPIDGCCLVNVIECMIHWQRSVNRLDRTGIVRYRRRLRKTTVGV